MRTRSLRADRITTEDSIVTGGEGNPLHEGGKRRAWKVSEITCGNGRVAFRLVLRGGAARSADAWLDHTTDGRTELRVLDRSEQLNLEVK